MMCTAISAMPQPSGLLTSGPANEGQSGSHTCGQTRCRHVPGTGSGVDFGAPRPPPRTGRRLSEDRGSAYSSPSAPLVDAEIIACGARGCQRKSRPIGPPLAGRRPPMAQGSPGRPRPLRPAGAGTRRAAAMRDGSRSGGACRRGRGRCWPADTPAGRTSRASAPGG